MTGDRRRGAALREQRTSVLTETRSLRADIAEFEQLGVAADPRRTARLTLLEEATVGVTR